LAALTEENALSIQLIESWVHTRTSVNIMAKKMSLPPPHAIYLLPSLPCMFISSVEKIFI
jgi:hypothetical protein